MIEDIKKYIESLPEDKRQAAITDIKIAHGQIQVAFGDVYLDAKHDEKNNVDSFDDDGDVVA